MPSVRYTVSGLAPQKGATAFLPVRARTTAVYDVSRSQGTPEEIVGQPGTQAVAAPYPGTMNDKQPDWYSGGYSESKAMPPVWYPSLYYRAQHLFRSIGGVAVYSDNIMPVPAIDPRGLPAGAIGPRAFAAGANQTPAAPARPNKWVGGLGQRQVSWPKRLPVWPGRNG